MAFITNAALKGSAYDSYTPSTTPAPSTATGGTAQPAPSASQHRDFNPIAIRTFDPHWLGNQLSTYHNNIYQQCHQNTRFRVSMLDAFLTGLFPPLGLYRIMKKNNAQIDWGGLGGAHAPYPTNFNDGRVYGQYYTIPRPGTDERPQLREGWYYPTMPSATADGLKFGHYTPAGEPNIERVGWYRPKESPPNDVRSESGAGSHPDIVEGLRAQLDMIRRDLESLLGGRR